MRISHTRRGGTIAVLAMFLGPMTPLTATAVQSLEVGKNFVSSNPDCTAGASSCEAPITVSETLPGWLHTLSVSAGFTMPGDGLCRVQAGIRDVSTDTVYRLMEVFATVYTPTTSSITLPTPIRFDPQDEVYINASVAGDDVADGECRAEAYFGSRVPPAEDD